MLVHALRAAMDQPADALTHGFHSYPARMHPAIAATVVHACSPARVLDPFCGGGTVLVQARVSGCGVVGVDLNPLAVRLAGLRASLWNDAARAWLVLHANEVVERSLERVSARTPGRAPLHPAMRQHYDSHVLAELSGLWEEVQACPEVRVREALQMVFSAMAIKFSRLRGDTGGEAPARRVGKRIPSTFFGKKAHALAQGLGDLANALGASPPPLAVHQGDVRRLPEMMQGTFPLIVTSPPYAGTYDYVQHHALRCAWLGLSLGPLSRGEMGARRRFSAPEHAGAWDREVQSMLQSMRRVQAPGDLAVILQGDGTIGERRVPADVQLGNLCAAANYRLLAGASVERPNFHGDAQLFEHLVALRAE